MSNDEGRHAGGRPPLYDDPQLMEVKIDQYFDDREAKKKPPTIAGLAFFLGFNYRQALQEYEKKPEFSATVKRARLRVEMDRTEKLVSSGTPTAGLIFDLCNNHGYKNPQHIKHSGDEDDETPIRNVTRIELVAPKIDNATD